LTGIIRERAVSNAKLEAEQFSSTHQPIFKDQNHSDKQW